MSLLTQIYIEAAQKPSPMYRKNMTPISVLCSSLKTRQLCRNGWIAEALQMGSESGSVNWRNV